MDVSSALKITGLSVLAFLRTHVVRILSGLLILGGCLFLATAHPYPLLVWLVLLCPPMLGLAVMALSLVQLSCFINGQDSRLEQGVQSARAKGTKPAKYLLRPVCWAGSFIWRLGKRLRNEHVRAAARVAGAAYLLAVVGFIVAVAAVIFFWLAVVAIVLMIALWVIGSSSDEEQKRKQQQDMASTVTVSQELPRAAVQGRFHRGTAWWNEELAGRVDEDGAIYKGSSWITEERIGRIDEDGRIYRGTSSWNEEEVGRIDEDGALYKGSNWFNRERAGRVTKDGEVLKGSSWWNEERVGKVDKD